MSARPPVPPLPPGFRERLLPTSADVVPAGYAETLRAFCEGIPFVETGYLCAVERTPADAVPPRLFSFAVRISSPVDTPDDSREALMTLSRAFCDAHGDLMREVGCGLLADRAVPAWDQYALRVFSR